ncbi:glycosyltransferase [Methylocaldum sp. MU1018]
MLTESQNFPDEPVTNPHDLPLVSVIIRSMDRPTLNETLQAVALQTYPNIEVVVVNAKGGEHRKLGDRCGCFSLRIVNDGGKPLKRAAAANAGLDAARGEYAALLDDDDTVDAGHYAHLADAVRQADGVRDAVAYAGVRCVDREDPKRQVFRVFAEPFEEAKLLVGNFIPLHAPLFPRRCFVEGVRFDESLDLYEDWDYWLQLSQVCRFIHTGRVTATYFTGGASGGSPFTPDPENIHRAALALFTKWKSRIEGSHLKAMSDLYHRRWSELGSVQSELEQSKAKLGKVQTALDDMTADLRKTQSELADAHRRLAACQAINQSLLNSISWRLTRPLRELKRTWLLAVRGTDLLRQELRRRSVIGVLRRIGEILSQEGANGFLYRFDRGLAADPPRLYSEWIALYSAPLSTAEKIAAMRSLAHRPTISVIMPVYNTPEVYLRRAIESVCAQFYESWELCIADDASTAPHVRMILADYASRDKRIRVRYRETNGHISAASNSALELATGEYVAFLDHDDELAPDALFWVAAEINAHPDATLLYSDEDKIDAEGQRLDAYFKPDFNPDLLRSHNLVTHLAVFRAVELRRLGGLRIGFEGAQDYDMVLRFVDSVAPSTIRHIPRILYHWRIIPGSTAIDIDQKRYAIESGRRAIAEHLARQGLTGTVLDNPEARGTFRVRYALPKPIPPVTLIIPTHNGLSVLRTCIDSILDKTDYPAYEIIVVDNGSDDPATLRYLDRLTLDARVRVLRDGRPFNFPALNNAAARHARGEVLGLLNNDLEVVDADWLEEMVSHAMRPGIGAVGARLWYPNDTLQHGGVILLGDLIAGHAHKGFPKGHPGYVGRAALIQNFSAVTAACLVVRKNVYDEVGGLDEQLAVAFNDVDFCLRLGRAGYRNLWTPFANLYHHESATRGYEDTPEKQARFAREQEFMRKRWGPLLFSDPAFNPNLSLDREDFYLAFPPRVSATPSMP